MHLNVFNRFDIFPNKWINFSIQIYQSLLSDRLVESHFSSYKRQHINMVLLFSENMFHVITSTKQLDLLLAQNSDQLRGSIMRKMKIWNGTKVPLKRWNFAKVGLWSSHSYQFLSALLKYHHVCSEVFPELHLWHSDSVCD